MKKSFYLLMALLLISSVSAGFIVVRPGSASQESEEELFVKINNINSEDDLDEVQTSLYIPDMDYYLPSPTFDVDDHEAYTVRYFLDTNVESGCYPVRVALMGDDVRKVKWTWLCIN
ncbi:hypothetical protein JXB41_08935 [Candidatus Woesearchaeota archaeon]|nr:hypothetical protein [Candidatus Woesearchaeota archaeon]